MPVDGPLSASYHSIMTSTVERIRKEASELPYDEREALVRVLELDLDSTTAAEEDPSEVEAAWSQEIAARVKDVEDGTVELISSEESENRLDALFAKHGVKRPE
jgi:hypothetical protein